VNTDKYNTVDGTLRCHGLNRMNCGEQGQVKYCRWHYSIPWFKQNELLWIQTSQIRSMAL